MRETEWEDKIFIHQLRKKKMIYSHETALFMNDLTDREPLVYSVTVPYGYNDSRLKKEGLVVHTVKDDRIQMSIKCLEAIQDEADYPGIRASIEAIIENTRQIMKIDITTGDIITPKEIEYDYKLLIEDS